MKSLSHRGGIAGNVKLRGKLEYPLGCGCCVVQNLKQGEIIRLQQKEIADFDLREHQCQTAFDADIDAMVNLKKEIV